MTAANNTTKNAQTYSFPPGLVAHASPFACLNAFFASFALSSAARAAFSAAWTRKKFKIHEMVVHVVVPPDQPG